MNPNLDILLLTSDIAIKEILAVKFKQDSFASCRNVILTNRDDISIIPLQNQGLTNHI
jgi:hypothetical protein